MTEQTRRPNPFDPTDERTADESTPGAGGLGAGEREPVNRETPEAPRRRHDAADEEEPALPNNDPTLKTKI